MITTTKLPSQFQVASDKERYLGVLMGILVGVTFAQSFLPTLHALFNWLPTTASSIPVSPKEVLEMISFPIAAGFFYFSLPRRSCEKLNYDAPLQTAESSQAIPWLRMAVVPLAIAFIFGLMRRYVFALQIGSPIVDLLWYVLLIPVGEELLFRGWLYEISRRLFRGHFFTATNPLPMEVWISAIAFALWHLQNLGNSGWVFVCFQLLYTFFTGLWLGYLRWKTGKITIPVYTHLLLNLAAMLPLFL